MRKLMSDAMTGMSFAGFGVLVIQFLGYNQTSLMILLYLYVALSITPHLKKYLFSKMDNRLLHRLVIVAEGEELHMKKLFTGEKYRIDGDVEKL